MTATVTGAYVDGTDEAAIEAQLLSLAVTSSEVIVIPCPMGTKIYLGKVVIT